jgi:superfamily II DNA or RNA helicase
LRAAASSRIELMAFQLEPALAAVRGLACRFLLADEVGLGKTIQAGLLINELRHRGLADRVLILTPSGLRRQWQAELSERFSIPASVVDSSLLRRRASSLPAATNPWLVDEVSVASIDLIKRPDAMRGLGAIVCDVLLIDEAHLAAQAAGRHRAAEALAHRARRVVLITATPHAGNVAAFEALCRIGGHDGSPLAIFRRSRHEVGLPSKRRVRTIAVALGPEESRVHERLRAYVQLVVREPGGHAREALLAMAVLMKRALSSPASLEISIARRLQMLSDEEPDERQLPLPLSGDSIADEHDDRDVEPCDVLGTPGLTDRARELTCLREIAAAARAVSRGRKLDVLTRLIARIREPVLVFTEYRDTLQHVAAALAPIVNLAVIHGGLTEAERIQAQLAFTGGTVRVLLATDAAGEGLNLQARCRLVVNLELPWNPMRLEQRIGRVDRLGQTRVVHAINLFARGTAEAGVLTRLVARLDSARRGVGHVNDPLGHITEDDVAGALLGAEQADPKTTGPDASDASDMPSVWRPDLREDAVAEMRRLQSVRRVAGRGATTDQDAALITTIASSRARPPLSPSSLVWLIRVHLVDGNGQLIEQLLVPLVGSVPGFPVLHKPRALRAFVETFLAAVQSSLFERALASAGRRLQHLGDAHAAALGVARTRERYLMSRIEAESVGRELFQVGLFDRRAARDRDAARSGQARLFGDAVARVDQLDNAGGPAAATDAELVLVLQIASRKLDRSE